MRLDRNAVIAEKLDEMMKLFESFKKFALVVTHKTYTESPPIRHIMKEEIRQIVESATEINNLILAGIKPRPARDYFNSFMELAENGIIDQGYARQIASSTGIRNLLVHGYDGADDEEIYQSVPDMIRSYERYFGQLSACLDR